MPTRVAPAPIWGVGQHHPDTVITVMIMITIGTISTIAMTMIAIGTGWVEDFRIIVTIITIRPF
jgi:hypothetical protein